VRSVTNQAVPPNRVVADANLSRMLWVTPQEAAGGRLESYLRTIHPDDRARVEATIAAAIQEGAQFARRGIGKIGCDR
jgi:PAS fold